MLKIKLDKFGGNILLGEQGAKELKQFKDIHSVCDPFRKIHKKVKEFTWSNGKDIFCRLDRFYISNDLINFVENICHTPSLSSDHDIVELKLSNLFGKEKRGPGYWKCNTNILEDVQLQAEMKLLFEELNKAPVKDVIWWENCKGEAKKLIIKHSILLAKEKNQKHH